MSELFDVLAIGLHDQKVRLLATDKTAENAEAIVNMAVIRRGLDTEFYTKEPTGTYKDGDTWRSA